VNEGLLEVAHVFLSDLKDGMKALTKLQNKLRLCFKEFLRKSCDALAKNKGLIGPDQRDYQRELENNYKNFTRQLMPMITLSRTSSNKDNEPVTPTATNQEFGIWNSTPSSSSKAKDINDGFPVVCSSSPVV
jgi:hypothetical protein